MHVIRTVTDNTKWAGVTSVLNRSFCVFDEDKTPDQNNVGHWIVDSCWILFEDIPLEMNECGFAPWWVILPAFFVKVTFFDPHLGPYFFRPCDDAVLDALYFSMIDGKLIEEASAAHESVDRVFWRSDH